MTAPPGLGSNSKMDMSNGIQNMEADIVQPIKNLLLENLSNDSMAKIKDIVKEVEKLSKFERLMLYMELPSNQMPSDPLRQPINPLGSRAEIQLTITWIRTHFEEDPQVSLPKHEVYDEYTEYCSVNALKPLSTADFGKVMKQVFPQVRPRRLGTRGNSRYCYAGLRKKVKLEEPSTPECFIDGEDKLIPSKSSKVDEASTSLLLEWAERLFKEPINSVKDLALYLIDKTYVDSRSNAALTLMSCIKAGEGFKSESNLSGPYDDNDAVKRKQTIHPLEMEMDACDTKRKRLETVDHLKMEPNVSEHVGGTKQNPTTRAKLPHKKDWSKNFIDTNASDGIKGNDSSTNIDDEISSYLSNNLDTAEEVSAKSEEISQLRQILEKNLKPATGTVGSAVGAVPSGSNESVIANSASNAGNSNSVSAFRPTSSSANSTAGGLDGIVDPNSLVRTSTWNNFRSEENSSGNMNTVSSSSDAIGSNVSVITTSTSQTLSHRRKVSFDPLIVQDSGSSSLMMSNSQTHQNSNSVSGGNNSNSVQPSPGSRKRHFSFQPISPRQNSLPQSPNASPFISPRSTPVPMLRSRHSSGSALPLHLLPQGSKNVSFGSSSSDTSRAATFGSTSECSTPFISPHGTPIPFNRSRHNSAQGRLTRSRHSSGLGLGGPNFGYRYNMTFSPMALNNLNNPYSPQPSTPIATAPEDMHLMSINNGSSAAGMMGNANGNQVGMTSATSVMANGNGGSGGPSNSGGVPTILQLNDSQVNSHQNNFFHNQRSRHSSAESEPAMRTVLMSPNDDGNMGCGSGIGGVTLAEGSGNVSNNLLLEARRHRHASAGHTPSSSNVWFGMEENEKLLGDMKPSSDAIEALKDDEGTFDEHNLMDTSTYEDFHTPKESHKNKEDDDDLDLALSALKDCDNDFSKFVQETENGK